MASDNYLKIDQVEGESVSIGFEKCMQIESYSFGATNPGSYGTGTGGGSGKPNLQDFHFTIHNGKASADLFKHCTIGTHIPKATLTLRKTGGDTKPYVYLEVEFERLVLSSFQCGGAGDQAPYDQTSFNFEKITYKYYQQDSDSGQPQLTNTMTYDVAQVQQSGA